MEILKNIAGLGIWITGFVVAAILSLRIGNRMGRGLLVRLQRRLRPVSPALHGLLFVFSGVTGGALGGILGGGLGGGFIGLCSVLMDNPTDLWTNKLLWLLPCAMFGSLIGGVAGTVVGLAASAIEGYISLKRPQIDQLP